MCVWFLLTMELGRTLCGCSWWSLLWQVEQSVIACCQFLSYVCMQGGVRWWRQPSEPPEDRCWFERSHRLQRCVDWVGQGHFSDAFHGEEARRFCWENFEGKPLNMNVKRLLIQQPISCITMWGNVSVFHLWASWGCSHITVNCQLAAGVIHDMSGLVGPLYLSGQGQLVCRLTCSSHNPGEEQVHRP